MLFIACGCIYATVVCWSWGSMVEKLFSSSGASQPSDRSVIITCFLGLGIISVIAGYLSLLFPLFSSPVQSVIVIPFVIAIINGSFLSAARDCIAAYRKFSFLLKVVLIGSVIVLLLMSSWVINHPDSIGYHIPVTKWISEYPVIPGLAHLHERYGFQSSWFLLSGLFHLPSAGTITYINTAVVIWLVAFITCRLSFNKYPLTSLGWLMLLAVAFWNYPMIRLTATSFSPDFIAAVFLWIVFYLLLTRSMSYRNIMLMCFFAVIAVTIKLSVAPVLILPVVFFSLLISRKNIRSAAFIAFAGIIAAAPFLIRNIISSGYALFPLELTRVSSPPKALSPSRIEMVNEDITSYSRIPVLAKSREDVVRALQMNTGEWLREGWKSRTASDKFLLLLIVAATVTLSYRIPGFIQKKNKKLLPATLIIFAGLVIWWWKAPDPRFATGFIIPLTAIAFFYRQNTVERTGTLKTLYHGSLGMICICICAYAVYRTVHYFDIKHLVEPAGIDLKPYTTVNCKGRVFTIPIAGGCGDSPLPCIQDSCRNFIPAGEKITDGFLGSP